MHLSTVATLITAAAASVAAAPVLDERATGIQVYLSNFGYVYGFPAGADPSKEYLCSTAAFVSSPHTGGTPADKGRGELELD